MQKKSNEIKILICIYKANYIPQKIIHKSDTEPKQGNKQYPQHMCSYKEYKTKCPFPLQTPGHVQRK